MFDVALEVELSADEKLIKNRPSWMNVKLAETLLRVRDALRAGRYAHKTTTQINGQMFSMMTWSQTVRPDGFYESCGTVRCIGGWCVAYGYHFGFDAYMWNDTAVYVMMHESAELRLMKPLFYPDMVLQRWGKITPEIAAVAIDNFLSTGDPDWYNITPL